jgi:hypothetical protein
MYPNAFSLSIDIMRQKQPKISIVEGNGFPGCARIAVHYGRELWYLNHPQSIGIIADADRHPVYEQMVRYLNEYLSTPCKLHCVKPRINRNDAQNILTIDYGDQPSIAMWTIEIPESLDIQISNLLKCKYPKLKKYHKNEIITATSKMLNISKEEVVRRSIEMFENKRWFKNFCKYLGERISSDS